MACDTSVIITNFNNKNYLGRAIRSCLKQSLERDRYEIIVVDDGSKDESREVIKSFRGIVPIYLKHNVGVARASNEGIKRALGAFVIRVDSDDYISEHALLFMTEILLANPDVGFVYPDHIYVDENERFVKRVDLDTIPKIKRHGAGIMFRKSNLEAIGLYDAKFRNAEDYDLLTRYFKNFDGYHLRLPLYRYRQREGTLSGKDRKKWEQKSDDKYRKT